MPAQTHFPWSTTVQLPDVFQSFASSPPRVNPHYESVKLESENWLIKLCNASPKMQTVIRRCNFSYFCAISAPDAPCERLRTVFDWGNWVFPYDDVFDDGDLRDQPEHAVLLMDSLMAIMLGRVDEDAPPMGLRQLPLIQAHDSVYRRMAVVCVRSRFARTMGQYCSGALKHVSDHTVKHVPSLGEMVLIRRESAGVSPMFHLVEYAHNLRVPDEVFASPLIQELETLGIDLNDGVPHNMIAACFMQGLSPQQAFDTVGELLTKCYQRWEEVESQLQSVSWAEDTSHEQARLYVEGIKNVVTANMYWSFKSERYFGSDGEIVRTTRQMDVLKEPGQEKRFRKNKKVCEKCEDEMEGHSGPLIEEWV
ncbi:isoprenoid synthase domain-containing protein [Microdochium bolleyi]|uniref:Terpene synthase n=1 Tax=Microdochium bolleyi TaxID=196109 RepID=A0A136INA2_9PEZI|nr:isoprenoid synthase domain-containing protein [Microdochium bolleyi]